MTNELVPQWVDRRVGFYQAIWELCPGVGPFVSKLLLEIIPNQRMDRIADVVRRLDGKVKELEDAQQAKLDEAEFVDLFEEGIFQATRAASPERREFIATILKNGLTTDRTDLVRERRLMMLLGDLNDLEVILLQFYNAADIRDEETMHRLEQIAIGPQAHLGSELDVVEREILHDSHRYRLAQLGLLRPHFAHMKPGELPEFDRITGGFKVNSYQIAPLGRLLMKCIDQPTIYSQRAK